MSLRIAGNRWTKSMNVQISPMTRTTPRSKIVDQKFMKNIMGENFVLWSPLIRSWSPPVNPSIASENTFKRSQWKWDSNWNKRQIKISANSRARNNQTDLSHPRLSLNPSWQRGQHQQRWWGWNSTFWKDTFSSHRGHQGSWLESVCRTFQSLVSDNSHTEVLG